MKGKLRVQDLRYGPLSLEYLGQISLFMSQLQSDLCLFCVTVILKKKDDHKLLDSYERIDGIPFL
jgi:hypothetical protein